MVQKVVWSGSVVVLRWRLSCAQAPHFRDKRRNAPLIVRLGRRTTNGAFRNSAGQSGLAVAVSLQGPMPPALTARTRKL